MLYKNLPESKLKTVMRTRTLLDMLSFVQFWLTGKKKNAQAILEARREFKKIMHEYQSKRIENQQKATLDNIPEMYRGLILGSFYLKGRKTFNNITWK